jgi:hypothetical protein
MIMKPAFAAAGKEGAGDALAGNDGAGEPSGSSLKGTTEAELKSPRSRIQ